MQCMSCADKYSKYDVNCDYNGLSMLLEAICRSRSPSLREMRYAPFKSLKALILHDEIQSLDISSGFYTYLVYAVIFLVF
jgi:hypothetical protein